MSAVPAPYVEEDEVPDLDPDDTIPDDAWTWVEEMQAFRVKTLGGESQAIAAPMLCEQCLGVLDETCSCV